MVLVIHLIVGNLLFCLFLVKRDAVLAYYNKCSKILSINGHLKKGEAVPDSANFSSPKPAKTNLFKLIFFYSQFVTIAWMLFLTTFLAAEIVIRLNPKIKEYL